MMTRTTTTTTRSHGQKSLLTRARQSTNVAASSSPSLKIETPTDSNSMEPPPSAQPDPLALVAESNRTLFEKRVWTALCQIPAGRVTTYGILASHLNSSPRAVGNALRRNPFAPMVPCHRVVSTGGALGGFKGKIGPRDGEGITLIEKRTLLKGEGIKFDTQGRVLGSPFEGFV